MKRILCLAIVVVCALCLSGPGAEGAKSSKKKSSAPAPAEKTADKPSVKAVAASDSSDPLVAEATAKSDPPKKEDAKKDDSKKDDKKDGKKDPAPQAAGGINFMGSGDFPFDRMTADSIEIDPKGMTIMTGKVKIESKDFNIACEQLKMDNNSKVVHATGSPVKMDQGPATQGQCLNLTYNLANKSALLENEAQIIRDNNGQKVQMTADTIKIDYPPPAPGEKPEDVQPKVSFIKKNGLPPEIKVLNKETTTAKPKGGKATPINGNNLDILSLPTGRASAPKTPGGVE